MLASASSFKRAALYLAAIAGISAFSVFGGAMFESKADGPVMLPEPQSVPYPLPSIVPMGDSALEIETTFHFLHPVNLDLDRLRECYQAASEHAYKQGYAFDVAMDFFKSPICQYERKKVAEAEMSELRTTKGHADAIARKFARMEIRHAIGDWTLSYIRDRGTGMDFMKASNAMIEEMSYLE